MQKKIIYEQPLSERVRNLLRLEYLFNSFNYYCKDLSKWGCYIVIKILIEINELIPRLDIKTELIKELEKCSVTLDILKNNSAVDMSRLKIIICRLNELLENLKKNSCRIGSHLKKDKLIDGIKQRISISAGTCSFDQPRFYQWLNQPNINKSNDIDLWKSDLSIVEETISFILEMLRNSTKIEKKTASSGFYQQTIDSVPSCRLIRVLLPADSLYYAEISAGKHRVTIRFFEKCSSQESPKKTDDDVGFELTCCIL